MLHNCLLLCIYIILTYLIILMSLCGDECGSSEHCVVYPVILLASFCVVVFCLAVQCSALPIVVFSLWALSLSWTLL